jgi:cytokinin dehydrogenase
MSRDGVTRRGFLSATGAAALTIGAFDATSGLWISEAEARPHQVRIPRLDGELTFDPNALEEASEDFGYLISGRPWAVLRPGSHRDVVRMVRFARRHRMKVAMRGQAHSTYGQAQAEGGVVIDSRTLQTVHTIAADHAWVDTGVVWRDLVAQTTSVGLAPPTLTDYLGLSIGGVLSVGGVGGTTFTEGFVADNCEELEVVTGDGLWVRCSRTRRRHLFEAVLGGLGQYALILKAKIRLVPQEPMARIYQLVYPTLPSFLADQRRVVADERFDFLEGQVVPNPDGGWLYIMEAGKWYGSTPPDDSALIGDLAALPPATVISDLPFIAWANRVEGLVTFLQANDLWTSPHPWSDLFLPDAEIEDFVATTLASLTPAEVGAGVQLLYPFRRSRTDRSKVQLPQSEILWLYDILRIPPRDVAFAESLVMDNRTLFDRATAAGGKRYPISAVPMNQGDWIGHYGGEWFSVVRSKARYDRRNTLTPGQRIFRR